MPGFDGCSTCVAHDDRLLSSASHFGTFLDVPTETSPSLAVSVPRSQRAVSFANGSGPYLFGPLVPFANPSQTTMPRLTITAALFKNEKAKLFDSVIAEMKVAMVDATMRQTHGTIHHPLRSMSCSLRTDVFMQYAYANRLTYPRTLRNMPRPRLPSMTLKFSPAKTKNRILVSKNSATDPQKAARVARVFLSVLDSDIPADETSTHAPQEGQNESPDSSSHPQRGASGFLAAAINASPSRAIFV